MTNEKEPLADKYLEELAQSENSTFRDYAARSPKTSSDILDAYVSSSYLLRQDVALNPATPVEILRKLAVSQDQTDQVVVARNPKLPIDIIETFAQTVDDEKLRTRLLSSLARNSVDPGRDPGSHHG